MLGCRFDDARHIGAKEAAGWLVQHDPGNCVGNEVELRRNSRLAALCVYCLDLLQGLELGHDLREAQIGGGHYFVRRTIVNADHVTVHHSSA